MTQSYALPLHYFDIKHSHRIDYKDFYEANVSLKNCLA